MSVATYLQRFNMCVKSADERYVAYASRLQGLLMYYVDNRQVTKFKELCELLLCDRVKSSLSENCLKHILSVESNKKKGWLPIKELTETADRFIAARGDTAKPKAFAVGQTPTKLFKPCLILVVINRKQLLLIHRSQSNPQVSADTALLHQCRVNNGAGNSSHGLWAELVDNLGPDDFSVVINKKQVKKSSDSVPRRVREKVTNEGKFTASH